MYYSRILYFDNFWLLGLSLYHLVVGVYTIIDLGSFFFCVITCLTLFWCSLDMWDFASSLFFMDSFFCYKHESLWCFIFLDPQDPFIVS